MSDGLIILWVWGVSLALQFLGWRWGKRFFTGLRDGGWAMGRLVTWLLVSLLIWILGHWGLRVNTDWGIGGAVLLLVGMGMREIWREKRRKKKEVFDWRWVLWEESLFLLGLVGLSLVRSFEPSIFSLEKFMDYGFIKKYMVSERLPATDIWWAGKTINYYSFGHFMVSVLVRIWGVGLERGYNLALGFILGLSLSLSFSLIVNTAREKKEEKGLVVGGLLGSLLCCLGGNSYTVWYLIKNWNWEGFWYADATRFIERTIHEFPGYSFVVSDLHAHVLGLPIVLGFLILVLKWLKEGRDKKRVIIEFLLGGLLGVMLMTNTWDLMIYGLVGLVVVISWVKGDSKGVWWRVWGKKKTELQKWLIIGLRVLVGGLLVGWWWWSYFKAIPSGVKIAREQSPLDEWLILWTGHLLLVLGVWFLSGKVKKEERLLMRVIAGVGVLLLVIPELVYVEDIYTSYPRANTMFKLTYQGFLLMSLSAGIAINVFWDWARKKWKRKLILVGMILVWGGLMLFPFQAYPAYYRKFESYQGLDGVEWMKKEEKDKWGAVSYLGSFADGKNLLEAGGDSYSRANSVSAFSGTSSVLGWRVHEWLWRGGYDKVREREIEVEKMFEMKDREDVLRLIKKYDVGWIYVGPEEKEKYEIGKGLYSLGEIVWRGEKARLIKIEDY